MTKFDRVMNFVLQWEGGYVNDPNDPGGETKFGISKRSHPHLDIKNLTREEALAIYREKYWDRIGGDKLDYPEALALMDFAVHSGVGTALEHWRESEDVWALQQSRREYLSSLKNFNAFGRGWMRRVNALDSELDQAVVPTSVELVQIYLGDRILEFEPLKVSVGRSRSGGRKVMARLH